MDLRYPQFLEAAVNGDVRGAHTKLLGATPEHVAMPGFTVHEVFYTTNHRDTLRGLHFQTPGQPKIIQAMAGLVVGNILCCDPELPEFGSAVEFDLFAGDGRRIYVPGAWAPGYRSLEDGTTILYLAGAPFAPGGDTGIDPFDPELALSWGGDGFDRDTAILSERDRHLQSFREFAEAVKR